jgi:hypothetical protein
MDNTPERRKEEKKRKRPDLQKNRPDRGMEKHKMRR